MARPAPGHTRAVWRRRIVAAFTERLLLKGTALALAIILWFLVGAREKVEELVDVNFQPQLDSTLVLRDSPRQIRALVLGTPSELLKLVSTPPVIRRPIAADAPDTLVVDLHPNDVVLPSGVDADVEDVRPRSITLRFEESSSRRVPVHSTLKVVGDSLTGPVEVQFDPAMVEVSGPRLSVLRTSFVNTVSSTIPASDSLPHLVDIDTMHLGLRVRPSQVKVRVIATSPRPAALPTPVPDTATRADSAVRVRPQARPRRTHASSH